MLYLFWVLLAASTALAFLLGAGPERVVAAALVVAAVATVLVRSPWALRYEQVETGVAVVDAILFVALTVIALCANRHWPMMVAAIQMDTLLGHLGKAANADLKAGGYILLITFPSYAICTLLIIATIRHQRRVIRGGAELSWAESLRRSVP